MAEPDHCRKPRPNCSAFVNAIHANAHARKRNASKVKNASLFQFHELLSTRVADDTNAAISNTQPSNTQPTKKPTQANNGATKIREYTICHGDKDDIRNWSNVLDSTSCFRLRSIKK